jgi:hypothetical protein
MRKHTPHFNIKLFYVTDLIERKEVRVLYYPTDLLVPAYMTKPLTRARFHKLKKIITHTG